MTNKPLAIDLYCGLFEAQLLPRADSAIEQLVTCGAEYPHHVALRVGGEAPRAVALEIRFMRDLKDAVLAAGFACVWHAWIAALQSVQRRVLVGAVGFVLRSSLRILASRPRLAQFSRRPDGAIGGAVAAVAVRRLDREVRAASCAIATAFRCALVLVSSYAPSSLCAVVAAPLLIGPDCSERRRTLSAKQIVHWRIVA